MFELHPHRAQHHHGPHLASPVVHREHFTHFRGNVAQAFVGFVSPFCAPENFSVEPARLACLDHRFRASARNMGVSGIATGIPQMRDGPALRNQAEPRRIF
jgi:hypothetical protein